MRFSENRKLATVVLIVCIIASIVLFGGGGLRNERYDILQVFSDGTDTSLSVRHSMEAYLLRCSERANALAEQGALLGADNALIESVRTAAAAVAEGGEDLDARHAAYQELLPAVESLYTALEQEHESTELVNALGLQRLQGRGQPDSERPVPRDGQRVQPQAGKIPRQSSRRPVRRGAAEYFWMVTRQ